MSILSEFGVITDFPSHFSCEPRCYFKDIERTSEYPKKAITRKPNRFLLCFIGWNAIFKLHPLVLGKESQKSGDPDLCLTLP